MFAVAVFYMYFTNIFRNMNATKYLFCCVQYFGWFGKGAVVGADGADGAMYGGDDGEDSMKHDGAADCWCRATRPGLRVLWGHGMGIIRRETHPP